MAQRASQQASTRQRPPPPIPPPPCFAWGEGSARPARQRCALSFAAGLPLKNYGVVVGRDLDLARARQAALAKSPLSVCSGESRNWAPRTTRLAKDLRFFARPRMPVHDGKLASGLERLAPRRGQAQSIRYAMERVGHEHEVHRLRNHLRKLIGVSGNEACVGGTILGGRCRVTSGNCASMSIAITSRASLAICSVNHPSPQHRSTTRMLRLTPTLFNTPAGSGRQCLPPA